MKPIKFCGYDVHPAANLFPMMTEQELDELKADIKKHGQIIPIVLYRDQILDGRNRAAACSEAGVSLKVINRDEIDDPISFAISANAKRRNLTKSQLATVAADSLPLYEAQAKARQIAAQNNDAGKAVREKVPEQDKGKAAEKAAAATGVNPRYVSDAKKIKEESPETFEKLKAGNVTLQEAKRDLWQIDKAHKPAEHAPEDNDPKRLWNLKRIWREASKKEKTAFLKWVEQNK